MSNSALILEWGSLIDGREMKALEEFNNHVAWWGELKKAGKLTDFRIYVPTTGSFGDRGGMVILEGSEKQIHELHASEELRLRVARAIMFVRNVRVNMFDTGDAIQSRMQRTGKVIKETV